MTEREFREAVLQQWSTGWEALHAGSAEPTDPPASTAVPWTADNETFSSDSVGSLGAWAQIEIVHTGAEQTTQGSAPSRKFERTGLIRVVFRALVDVGFGVLSDLTEEARTVLEGVRLDGANLHAGDTREGASDGVWASSRLVVPFRYTRKR